MRVVIALLVILAIVGVAYNINNTYEGSLERFVNEAPGDLGETIVDIARRTVTMSGNN